MRFFSRFLSTACLACGARARLRGLALAPGVALLMVACSTPEPAPAPAPPLPPLQAQPISTWAAPSPEQLALFDAQMRELMRRNQVPGLAVAVIRSGRIVHRQAFGLAIPGSDVRPAQPLRTDTVMYAASLTKAAFAVLVMQLVEEGVIDLDAPLAQVLRQPLPRYEGFADLASDERWRSVTMRHLLSHSSGLPNWRFLNVGNRLDFKYAPGERYVYSGEGIQIAQLVVEERTGKPLIELMRQRVFDRYGMPDTSLIWQDRFRQRISVGVSLDGGLRPQRAASRARAAGSMVTTLDDYANFLVGVLRREGLSTAAHQQMLAAQIAIVSPQQFPSHFPGQTTVNEAIGLSSGLGWIVHRSPQGRVFFKEGNDDGTNNFALGFADTGDGLLLLSNSSRADAIFYPLVELLFSPSCLPWFWMGYVPYDRPELRGAGVRDKPVGPDERCLKALE